jgi:ubiquinone/menaquinone biosynthesis C-methylase UbiE
MERAGVAEHRQALLAGLKGRVIEVGAGNGLNFAHYPDEVTSVLAVEPEPHLLRIASNNARRARVPIDLVFGLAERLPAAPASFDAAVVSLVLCTVANQRAALSEIRRVLRTGGGLRFFEHVRAGTPALERLQRALDATIWPAVAGGCHASRDTIAAIEQAGFKIERIDRFRFPETAVPFPTSPHVIGSAIRT